MVQVVDGILVVNMHVVSMFVKANFWLFAALICVVASYVVFAWNDITRKPFDKMVRLFMQKAGHDVPPRVGSPVNTLYRTLITEEFLEFMEADTDEERLDGAIDLLWVTYGWLLSSGFDYEGAIRAVAVANFSKNFSKSRASGVKVTKPTGWRAPNMTPFVQKKRLVF